MATTWTIICEAAGITATIEVVDSWNPLPGSDTWRAVEGESVWGAPADGAVANWAVRRTLLHAGAMSAFHILEDFGKETKVNSRGRGEKAMTGGTFPDGLFTWKCSSKR